MKKTTKRWFFILGSLLFCAIISYSIFSYISLEKRAKRLSSMLTEGVEQAPWLGNYIAFVNNMYKNYFEIENTRYIENLADNIPFSDSKPISRCLEKLKYYRTPEVLSAKLEEWSDNLHIPYYIIEYPKNQWIETFCSRNHITPQDITSFPGFVMAAAFELPEMTNKYSLEKLRDAIAYKNRVISGCEENEFDGSRELLAYMKKHLVGYNWESWLNRSEYRDNYIVRIVNDQKIKLSTVKHSSIELRNLAPYSISAAIQYPVNDGTRYKVEGWYNLDAGGVINLKHTFIDLDPNYYVHMQSNNHRKTEVVTDQINELIRNNLDTGDVELQLRIADNGCNLVEDTHQYVSNEVLSFESDFESDEKRSENDYRASFAQAKALDETKEKWCFLGEHPGISLFDISQYDVSNETAKEKASELVAMLELAIERQQHYKSNNESPFSLGAQIIDNNGPFVQGVALNNCVSESIRGNLMPYRNGDTLLSLDGNPVYGARDLFDILIEHGNSHEMGYEIPLKVEIQRGEEVFNQETSYFFNPNSRAYKNITEAEAAFWGAEEAVTLSVKSKFVCEAYNLGAIAVDGAAALLEWGFSKLLGYEPDYKSAVILKLVGNTHVTGWEMDQRKAIAQQKYGNVFEVAEIAGMFLPSPVRLFGTAPLKKFFETTTKLGPTSSRMVAASLLEGVETAIYLWNTAPPEASTGTKIEELIKITPCAMGIGFISGIII